MLGVCLEISSDNHEGEIMVLYSHIIDQNLGNLELVTGKDTLQPSFIHILINASRHTQSLSKYSCLARETDLGGEERKTPTKKYVRKTQSRCKSRQ